MRRRIQMMKEGSISWTKKKDTVYGNFSDAATTPTLLSKSDERRLGNSPLLPLHPLVYTKKKKFILVLLLFQVNNLEKIIENNNMPENTR